MLAAALADASNAAFEREGEVPRGIDSQREAAVDEADLPRPDRTGETLGEGIGAIVERHDGSRASSGRHVVPPGGQEDGSEALVEVELVQMIGVDGERAVGLEARTPAPGLELLELRSRILLRRARCIDTGQRLVRRAAGGHGWQQGKQERQGSRMEHRHEGKATGCPAPSARERSRARSRCRRPGSSCARARSAARPAPRSRGPA